MTPYKELRKRLTTDSACPWELTKPGQHERWELPGGHVFILARNVSYNGHARQNYLKQIERAETAYLDANLGPLPEKAPEPRPLPFEVELPAPEPAIPSTGLQTLNFGDAPIRLVVKDGEPWWVAADVCGVLGLANHRDALSRLDSDEKDAVGINDAIGRPQQTSIVNESGVYSLTFRSIKPEAKAFKKWITSEVLPSIRKKGSYSVKDPFQDMSRLEWIEYALLAEKEKEERGKTIAFQQQTIGCQAEEIQVLTEVAEEASARLERIAGAPIGSLCLKEAAKHLQVSPTWFNDWLRDIRWIYRGPLGTPLAFQNIINSGWLAHTVREYSYGPSYKMVVVTPSGLVRLSMMLEKAS